MPNWCENTLELSSEKNEDIQSFQLELVKLEGKGLLNFLVPQPDGLKDEPTKEGGVFPEWYEWNINNWGTKWDVDFEMDVYPDWIIISFDSAWSPPDHAIKALIKNYPNLTVKLVGREPGMGYEYRLMGEKGEVTIEEERELW